jgi:hypothetical protein
MHVSHLAIYLCCVTIHASDECVMESGTCSWYLAFPFIYALHREISNWVTDFGPISRLLALFVLMIFSIDVRGGWRQVHFLARVLSNAVWHMIRA